jgi:hypothetical protein
MNKSVFEGRKIKRAYERGGMERVRRKSIRESVRNMGKYGTVNEKE